MRTTRRVLTDLGLAATIALIPALAIFAIGGLIATLADKTLLAPSLLAILAWAGLALFILLDPVETT